MWNFPNTQLLGNETQLKTFRKPMQIELYDQQGSLSVRYNLYNCWPSEYTALPDLDGSANVVALASMTIEHEGWDRDDSVTYPPSWRGWQRRGTWIKRGCRQRSCSPDREADPVAGLSAGGVGLRGGAERPRG